MLPLVGGDFGFLARGHLMLYLVVTAIFLLWLAIPFALYPLAMAWLASRKGRQAGHQAPAQLTPAQLTPAQLTSNEWRPLVSVVVAAHNELAVIGARVRNLLDQDWPLDKLEILIASDASTDGTDEAVLAIASPAVRLVRSEPRAGKTTAVQKAVAVARGDVLLFSDASTRWEPQCIRQLVQAIGDPGVGCVSGRVLYERRGGGVASGFLLWQKIAVSLRRAEGQSGGLISVSGCIHGLRRELWKNLPLDIDPDLVLPAIAASAGLNTLYVADAIAWELPRESVLVEFRARRRIAARAIHSGVWATQLALRAGSWAYLARLTAHKWLRWTAWLASVGLVAVAALGSDASLLLQWLLYAQVGFYALAAAGLVAAAAKARVGPLAAPAYWLLANLALLLGTLDVLRKDHAPVWQTTEG